MRRWFRGAEDSPAVSEPAIPEVSVSESPVVEPSFEIAPMTWDEAHWFVGLASDGDHSVAAELERQSAIPGRQPDEACEQVLVEFRCLAVVDWKFPAGEVTGWYNNLLQVQGLEPLAEAEVARLHALDPVDARQDDLFFPDLAAPLDGHASSVGRRLLGLDEGADSYAFMIVSSAAFEALVGYGFGRWACYDATERFQRR
jgi:hypothetical protein